MKVVEKSVKDLKMYENNPRNNDQAVDEVAKSIQQFGFKVPMVIDTDNVIVCGHTRYKACLQLGIKKVPCIVASDLTPEQIQAFRIAENRTNELATWDNDKLRDELKDLISQNFDIESLGFNIDDFYTDETEKVEEDFYEVSEDLKPRAKLGQVYILGNHVLMCGDSTKAEDVDKLCRGGGN
jgi:site-specific DNA-methyltransferase (adenine-specific)